MQRSSLKRNLEYIVIGVIDINVLEATVMVKGKIIEQMDAMELLEYITENEPSYEHVDYERIRARFSLPISGITTALNGVTTLSLRIKFFNNVSLSSLSDIIAVSASSFVVPTFSPVSGVWAGHIRPSADGCQ